MALRSLYVRCGRCSKEATQQPAGFDPSPRDGEDDRETGYRVKRVVRCNVHAGAEKRATYPSISKFWEPISDETRAVVRVFEDYVAVAAEKRAAEREVADHQRRREIAQHYWDRHAAAAAEDLTIVYREETRSQGILRVWSVVTLAVKAAMDEDPEDQHYHETRADVIVEDYNSGYDDIIEPIDIRTRGSSAVTPKEVPFLIEAMAQAGQACGAINARRLAAHTRAKRDWPEQ